MISTIFLVKSPLQLLNANEAREYYGIPKSDSLLIFLADKKSQKQLWQLVRRDDCWENVVAVSDLQLIPVPTKDQTGKLSFGSGLKLFQNDFFSISKLRCLARILTGAEKVFIGDISNPLMRHFANCLSNIETIALDDGTATLYHVSTRYGQLDSAKTMSASKKCKLFLKRFFLGLKDRGLDRVTFFSVYDIKAEGRDISIRHDFSYLRGNLEKVDAVESVYFLGSPLVEAGLLSGEEYFKQLDGVKKELAGKEIVYVAHRREDPRLVEDLSSKLGWEKCLFDYPIEYQLASIGPKPALLTSFVCSALENCLHVFGEKLPIVSYRLDPEWFSQKDTAKGRRIYNLYEHYRSIECKNFKVVSLCLF